MLTNIVNLFMLVGSGLVIGPVTRCAVRRAPETVNSAGRHVSPSNIAAECLIFMEQISRQKVRNLFSSFIIGTVLNVN